MPQRITALLPSARLQPYWDFWAAGGVTPPPSADAIDRRTVRVAGRDVLAWYEVLAYVEMIVRHALDTELRARWNAAQGNGPEWLTNPAAPLGRILGRRVLSDLQAAAARAERGRAMADPHFGPYPRQGVPIGHDDFVAQLNLWQSGAPAAQ